MSLINIAITNSGIMSLDANPPFGNRVPDFLLLSWSMLFDASESCKSTVIPKECSKWTFRGEDLPSIFYVYPYESPKCRCHILYANK